MSWKKIILFSISLIFLASCAAAQSAMDERTNGLAAGSPPMPAMEGEAGGFSFNTTSQDSVAFDDGDFEEAPMDTGSNSAPQSQVAQQERLIIRTADLRLVVDDTEIAITSISDMVEGNGGWVVNSNVYQSGESKRGSITVRVPATGFDSALDAMKAMANEVTNESIAGQDVTDEFVDLTLRLENLEATADRVRSFLDDADEVEDALAVNIELSRLEGEIELIKGRREYLSQSAQFSTITVDLIPDALNQPITVAGWEPQGIAKDAVEALVEALQGTGSFLIWFAIYLLPLLLLYGVPLFLLGRWLNRWRLRRRERRLATPSTEVAGVTDSDLED